MPGWTARCRNQDPGCVFMGAIQRGTSWATIPKTLNRARTVRAPCAHRARTVRQHPLDIGLVLCDYAPVFLPTWGPRRPCPSGRTPPPSCRQIHWSSTAGCPSPPPPLACVKEEGHSKAGEATRTTGTGNQNGAHGRACAWEAGTWASCTQKHSEASYGRPVDRGAWTAQTVK